MAGRKLDKRSKVCVGLVGLGNLGTAIGNLAANNGYEVIGWEYYGSVVDEINSEHTNTRFLSGVELNRRLAGTRDLEEVAERGAKAETFSYLAGLGDLLTTSLSPHSHNRRMGELLAKGKSLQAVEEEMSVLPEGYKTLRMVLDMAGKLHISLPLARGP